MSLLNDGGAVAPPLHLSNEKEFESPRECLKFALLLLLRCRCRRRRRACFCGLRRRRRRRRILAGR